MSARTLERHAKYLKQKQKAGQPGQSPTPSMAASEGDEEVEEGGPLPSPSSTMNRIPLILSSRSPSTDAGDPNTADQNV